MLEKEELKSILEFFSLYKGRISGTLIGFLAAVLIIRFGIILATFIMLCMGIGYYFGLRYDNREDLREIINDILPSEK